MIQRFLKVVLVGCVLATTAGAQDIDTQRMGEVARFFASNAGFMGSVLVARGDEILFDQSYGSANLEWEVPNTAETRFRIGSLTKQFTAAAILLLEERGKLSTDDLVSRHMPDAPPAWEDVTLFNLLTHTAGLPNFQVSLNAETTIEQTVRSFRDLPLRFEPGAQFDYKNSGYQLLGYLVERVSGESYEEFLRENIFAPLGMNDTGMDSNAAVIPRRASGYVAAGAGNLANAPFIHMSVPHGAGGLYSTTGDLFRWCRGLFGGRLLSAESIEKMTTPFMSGYAFGLQVFDAGGRRVITHAGEINGFTGRLSYFPESDSMLVVLSNTAPSPADQIAGMMNRLVHGEPVPLPAIP